MVGVVGIEPTLLTAYLAAALRDYKFRPMANISNTPKKFIKGSPSQIRTENRFVLSEAALPISVTGH